MQTASKKVINSWAMYDWANSVYNLVITSTIFPAYFEEIARNNSTTKEVTFLGRTFANSSLNNYALAIAFLIVALMSPILSSIADCKGNKKSFMQFFMTMGSIACCGLYFFNGLSTLGLGIICMIVACVGYWSSLVFYNSFLPEIAAPEDRDRVSAKGFAMGYIGSVILQVICFVFVLSPKMFGTTTGGASRFSFLLVGIWWFAFAMISLKGLPKSIPSINTRTKESVIKQGYAELNKVWKQLIHLPVLKRFLLSFFFYNMGVQTVMLAATLYGKSELNIPTQNLIIAILIIQIIAIPGAYLMSKLSDKIGNIKSLMIAVVLWITMCYCGYLIPRDGIMQFYILAVLVGFIMGGIQSLSRSTYSKLMPETNDTTSFFSFFDVTEKVAIVIGIFSFGLITEATGSQRNSVLALVVFFVVGLIGLFFTLKASNTEKSLS
ncbi:MAG: MFS transporter [Bacteroidetes bacterium]|nr:MFS transporter [Bacteroidota bacterium]